MRILAVDDDPIILELLEQFMHAVGGHTLAKAENAMEALTLLETDSAFDCFMLDIQMPGKDGVTLAREIRAMSRHTDTPILMLTAMADKRYIDAAFAAGATDYVTKPFEVAELKARLSQVESMLEGRRSRTAKIFAAKAASAQPGAQGVELHEPISIHDVDNVIEYMAMENYVGQLTRSALFGSTTFAFTMREVARFHAAMTPFEFYSLISDVAEVISDTLQGRQFLMSYAGNGTFVCITESGWRPDMNRLADAVNLSLAQTELYDNQSNRLHPRVCAGEAVRLIWKSGTAIMDALAKAHASAEEACEAHAQAQTNYWDMGRTA